MPPVWTWLAFLLTFIVAIVGAFAYKAAPITSILYALGEGSLLSIASRYFDVRQWINGAPTGMFALREVTVNQGKGGRNCSPLKTTNEKQNTP